MSSPTFASYYMVRRPRSAQPRSDASVGGDAARERRAPRMPSRPRQERASAVRTAELRHAG